MAARKYNQANSTYRYGFNGKENDNVVKGDGNQQDYGMRVYDPRIGKFLSTDPLCKDYPQLTPYQFASNRPTDGIDLDGLEYIKPIPKFGYNHDAFDISKGFDNAFIDLANGVVGLWNSGVDTYKGLKGGTYIKDVKTGAKQFASGVKQTVKNSVYNSFHLPVTKQFALVLTNPENIELGVNLYLGFKTLPTGGNKGNLLAPTTASSSTLVPGSFDYYMNIAKTGDFSTPKNAAVFYSGAGNDAKAIQFVKLNPGKMTIDMTSSGITLDQAKLYEIFPAKQADAIMSEASKNFANGASGDINAFVKGAKAERIYTKEEKPILSTKADVNLKEHK